MAQDNYTQKIKDLEKLVDKVSGKNVIITNTYHENSFAFLLAHVLRNHTSRLYCIDPKYKMENEPEGYRKIENGNVVLVKGDLNRDRDTTLRRIGEIYGDAIDLEIQMECK